MQKMHNEEKDKFEVYLDEMIEKLQACQREKAHEYVQAVYNSMSKGDTGGFEF
jgi:hypothetical protein